MSAFISWAVLAIVLIAVVTLGLVWIHFAGLLLVSLSKNDAARQYAQTFAAEELEQQAALLRRFSPTGLALPLVPSLLQRQVHHWSRRTLNFGYAQPGWAWAFLAITVIFIFRIGT